MRHGDSIYVGTVLYMMMQLIEITINRVNALAVQLKADR